MRLTRQNTQSLGLLFVAACAWVGAGCASEDSAQPADNDSDVRADVGPSPDSRLVDASADTRPDAAGADGARTEAGVVLPPSAFDLNDVSFLYPLPDWQNRDDLMALSRLGAGGPLLSTNLFAQLPLLHSLSNDTNSYEALRVVGVRIDPCFPAAAANTCVRQIRLVAQPIELKAGPAAGLSTVDASLHLFYSLSDAQWTALLSGLRHLKELAGAATRGVPLQVHPVVAAEGLKGPYAMALNQLILSLAGDANLTRVAAMTLVKADTEWTFLGFDRTGAGLTATNIPRLATSKNQKVHVIFTRTPDANAPRRTSLDPPPPVDEFSNVLSTETVSDASVDVLNAGLKAALFMESPVTMSNPHTTDCGSCHVASAVRGYAERLRATMTTQWPERFTSTTYDLRRADQVGDDARSLRAFGYFGTQSAVNPRTANETAVVAAAMSAL